MNKMKDQILKDFENKFKGIGENNHVYCSCVMNGLKSFLSTSLDTYAEAVRAETLEEVLEYIRPEIDSEYWSTYIGIREAIDELRVGGKAK